MGPYEFLKPVYHIGSYTLSGYFLFLTVAFAVGLQIALPLARYYKIRQVYFYDIAFIAVAGGVLGGRLFHAIFEKPDLYFTDFWSHPLKIFEFWNGGLVYYGGLLVSFVAVSAYVLIRKLPYFTMADILAPCIVAGLGAGRIGCLAAGCCYGKVTDWWWGIQYRIVDGVYPLALSEHPEYMEQFLHPTPILSIISAWLICLLLLYTMRFERLAGLQFFIMLIPYSMSRFVIEYLRNDLRGEFFGGALSTSQLISIPLFLGSIIILTWQLKKRQGGAGDTLS